MGRKKKSDTEFYSLPLVQKGAALAEEQEHGKAYYSLPVSRHSDTLHKVLNAGEALDDLPQKERKVSKNAAEITVSKQVQGKGWQLVSKGKNIETTIEIGDIEKLIGRNTAAKKMLHYALIKVNEQAYDYRNGLHHDLITFGLQELVDIGYYGSIRTARRGITDAAKVLTDIKLGATSKAFKKVADAQVDEEGTETAKGMKTVEIVKASESTMVAVLFPTVKIENNQCSIRLNKDVNWKPLLQYFTPLPKFAFKLGNRAFDLLYSIVYLARQNADELAEHGYFTISFRTIQNRLNLPSENGNKNPQITIRQPVEAVIGEITKELKAVGKAEELKITPVCDKRANIKDYLDKGYLKVEMKGGYAAPLIELSEKKGKKIEQKKKRNQAIVDKAKAGALQKKLEAEQGKKQASGAV